MRVGHGYDVHRFGEGAELVLGGVHIPFDRGLQAHSDGDVLVHAVCDALLGAMGAGDIGEHFPDTDPKWKDAESIAFLDHTAKMLAERGLTVSNIDVTVIAAEPNLAPHKGAMAERIASSLGEPFRRTS